MGGAHIECKKIALMEIYRFCCLGKGAKNGSSSERPDNAQKWLRRLPNSLHCSQEKEEVKPHQTCQILTPWTGPPGGVDSNAAVGQEFP